MAEIGLVASVAQIADTGIKLSITLYTFAETNSDRISKKDQKSRLCSENAVKTAEGIVKECAAIFDEINGTLETTLEKIKPRAGSEKGNVRDGRHGGRKLAVAALERLKWPFLQPKMQLLRSNLDRLKSTLVLMLNVITYARKVSEDHAPPSTLKDQRKLIEDLARSNQEYTRKFKELTKAVEAGRDHVEAAKTIPTMENIPSSAFLQANMVLPPSESFHIAGDIVGDTSPDITTRLTALTNQHLPPDAGERSDELAHYCLLINHLLQRINAVQYKIKGDLRRRIRSDVVHMHQREADQLRNVHGHRDFTIIMGSAISWAEILHPTESGASQTLRNLIQPGWSEQVWNKFDALLERGDDLAPPSFPSTSTSGTERQGELGQLEKRVERMIALERLMRPFAAGEEDTPKRAAGASYRKRRKESYRMGHLLVADKDESEGFDDVTHGKQVAASAIEKLKARARASDGQAELQNEAGQLSSQKSDNVDDATMLYSRRRLGSSSPHREVHGLTTDTTTSKITLRDSFRPTTPSSRFNTGSKLHEPELLEHKYTAGIELSYGETNSSPTSNPLDQERARLKKAMDDPRDSSLNMLIFSEGEGTGVLLAGDLQILDALTSIRDKIREVASFEHMALQSKPTGSVSEIAEDAFSTAQKLWRLVRSIHESIHGHISPADRVLAVARLAELVLESVPVTVQDWKGRADTEKKIDSILDGRKIPDEAIARREALRKASRKFALLTSSQRRSLREAWTRETKDKVNLLKGWKLARKLSRSVTSFNLRGRRNVRSGAPKLRLAEMEERAESTRDQEIHELPGRGEDNVQTRKFFGEVPSDVTPPVRNDEQNEKQTQLPSGHARILEKSKSLKLESAHADRSNEALSLDKSDVARLMEMASYSRGEPAYSEHPPNLGSWADESADAPPEPRNEAEDEEAEYDEAEDVEPEYEVYADNMWDSDEDLVSAPRAEDDNDHSSLGIEIHAARPRTPDIVDNLLAEWTTLPR